MSSTGTAHDSRLSKWGVTLFRSTESIQFGLDGLVTIEGTQKIRPWPFAMRLGPFQGRVVSPSRAHYSFRVLGLPAEFRTEFGEAHAYMRFRGAALAGEIEQRHGSSC